MNFSLITFILSYHFLIITFTLLILSYHFLSSFYFSLFSLMSPSHHFISLQILSHAFSILILFFHSLSHLFLSIQFISHDSFTLFSLSPSLNFSSSKYKFKYSLF